MEFEIDFSRVRAIVAQEYDQARADIEAHGPVEAYRRSLARHDERLASAPDAPSLACRAGCAWCCYFTVDIRTVEALNILQAIEALNPQERNRVHGEIASNYESLKELSDDERARRNVKCPFLAATASGGHCVIYSSRPQTCRNYHATDVLGCKQSFDEPDNVDIDPDFAPLVYQTGGAHVEAFSKALHDAGYDTDAYELNTALDATLKNPEETRRRFESKQQPFAAIAGTDVPYELIEVGDNHGG